MLDWLKKKRNCSGKKIQLFSNILQNPGVFELVTFICNIIHFPLLFNLSNGNQCHTQLICNKKSNSVTSAFAVALQPYIRLNASLSILLYLLIFNCFPNNNLQVPGTYLFIVIMSRLMIVSFYDVINTRFYYQFYYIC